MNATSVSRRGLRTLAQDSAAKGFLLELLCSLALFAIFQVVYVSIEYPIFSYVGYTLNVNRSDVLLGWLIYLAAFLGIYSQKDSMSNIFLYVYLYLSVAPCIVIYMYADTALWMVAYQLLFLLLIRVMVLVLDTVCHRRVVFSKKRLELASSKLLWLVVLAFFAFMLLQNGLPNISDILFENVSEVRANYEASLVIVLLQNLMCKILIPLMISAAFEKKKWGLFALACIVQVYIYSVTGFKTFLLIPVLIIGTKFLRTKSFKRLIVWGLPLAMGGALVLFLLIRNNMFAAIVFNRLVFLPAKIKECYFDFFSQNDFVYFTQSSLASIFGIESNYQRDVVFLIGEKYFNSPDMWTNCGFLADAYANWGMMGGFLMSLLLAFELHLLNNAVHTPAKNYASAIFLIFFIGLNDGGLISVSVSGGFLLAILLIYVTRAGEYE